MIASIVIFANKDITKGEFQKQMKNLKWIIGLVILVIVGYTIFNGSESAPKQDNAAYTQQLQNARKEKDEFFKTGKESPIEDKVQNFANFAKQFGFQIKRYKICPKRNSKKTPSLSIRKHARL